MNSLENSTILAVDDDSVVLLMLKAILAKKCKELILQSSSENCLELAQNKQPSLILLDVMIGRNNGYEICQQLKANPLTEHIPVIFLSGLGLPQDKVKGFSVGGVDYIAKPFDKDEVLARISSCLTIHQKLQQVKQNDLAVLTPVLQSYQLTKREIEILHLYILGQKRTVIAETLQVSENTIKWYLKQIFQKLHVDSRAKLQEKIRSLRI